MGHLQSVIDRDDKQRRNKRELLETDRYTKHSKAVPYVRDKRVPIEEHEDDMHYNFLLDDWHGE